MTSADKCSYCPRQTSYDKVHDLIEKLRDFHTNHGEEVLDDTAADRLVNDVNALGVLTEPLDVAGLRASVEHGFELIDQLENFVKTRQTEETRFCIGALRMRAKDNYAQYDVAICRSPNKTDIPFFEGLEIAAVTKKTI